MIFRKTMLQYIIEKAKRKLLIILYSFPVDILILLLRWKGFPMESCGFVLIVILSFSIADNILYCILDVSFVKNIKYMIKIKLNFLKTKEFRSNLTNFPPSMTIFKYCYLL